MNERQKRLIEVYNFVRQHYPIHTKTDFANAVKYGRTSMSAALNGSEEYLTDALFKKICKAYPGIFNLDYLLTGRGELLSPIPLPQGQQVSDVKEVEYTHNLFDLAMQVIKDNEALHRQLQASIAELRSLIDRYGPLPGTESPIPQKIIHEYPSIVEEDKNFEEVK
jgi:hypothetical protein